jgi:hypothetical protein
VQQQVNSYRFTTKKGSVSLKTIVSKEKTSTNIIVMEGTKIVYQKQVISQHSLILNPALV